MDIRPIRSADDHEAALREIDRLWGAPSGTPDGDKLDVLATLVERFEEREHPFEQPSPVEMIKFVMEQNGYGQADLAKLLGSRSRASEVLSGKRKLTLEQIRLLHSHWRIPLNSLIDAVKAA